MTGDQRVGLMKSVPRPFVPCGLNAGGAPPLKLPLTPSYPSLNSGES